MKPLIFAFSLLMAVLSGQVYAHGDHGAINEKGAKAIAARVVQKMTVRDFGYDAGQLSSDWRSVDESQVSIQDANEASFTVEVKKADMSESVFVVIKKNGSVTNVLNNLAE